MSSQIQSSMRLAVGIASALAFLCTSFAAAQPAGTPGTTITVNTPVDGFTIIQPPPLPGQPLPAPSPPPCTLRAAIQAANTNKAVDGCPAGQAPRFVAAQPLRIDGIDHIVFNIGAGTPRIQLRYGLPHLTEAVTIDGATGGAARVEIAGNQILSLVGPVQGLAVTGTYATLKSLVVNGFSGSGIVLSHEDGDGIVVVTPGRPERPQPDPGGFPIDPCGPEVFPRDPDPCPPPIGPNDDVDVFGSLDGGGNTVLDCLVGTDAAGNAAVPNGTGTPASAGVAVLSPGNTIGGTVAGARNVISGNRGNGVLLDGRNNHVIGNLIGLGLNGSTPVPNQFDGVYAAGGQFAGATGEVRENRVFNNGGDGVDAGYNSISILANRFSANGGLGIERAEVGVTPNDATGGRNRPPSFPVLTKAKPLGGLFNDMQLSGYVTQLSSDPITIEVFSSSSCDPSLYGEGSRYLGSTTVPGGVSSGFSFFLSSLPLHGYFTATATTVFGTSELSACLAY